MTRKNYIALAAAFNYSRPYIATRSTRQQRAQMQTWHEIRGKVMQVLAADNPRFDRQRFLEATEKLQ